MTKPTKIKGGPRLLCYPENIKRGTTVDTPKTWVLIGGVLIKKKKKKQQQLELQKSALTQMAPQGRRDNCQLKGDQRNGFSQMNPRNKGW